MRFAFASHHFDKSVKIKKWDWLLIFSIILAPMTGLRFWKVGPAEVLCLIWSLRFFPQQLYKNNRVLLIFSYAFLFSIILGVCSGIIIAPSELNILDVITWAYLLFVVLSIYHGMNRNDFVYNNEIAQNTFDGLVYWNIFLWAYSLILGDSFLGASIWYGGMGKRFAGCALNPHQVAMPICAAALWHSTQFFNRCSRLKNAVLFFITIFLLWQTRSSTGYLSVLVGLLFQIYFVMRQQTRTRTARHIYIVCVIIGALSVGLLFNTMVIDVFMRWVAEDPSGMGRIYIFSSIGESFLKSPIFGLGPGIHALGGTIEFHNTYLELLAMSGIVGSIIVGVFTYRIFKTFYLFPMFMPIVVVLYSYGLAGFSMRRLVFWAILVLLYTMVLNRIHYYRNNKYKSIEC